MIITLFISFSLVCRRLAGDEHCYLSKLSIKRCGSQIAFSWMLLAGCLYFDETEVILIVCSLSCLVSIAVVCVTTRPITCSLTCTCRYLGTNPGLGAKLGQANSGTCAIGLISWVVSCHQVVLKGTSASWEGNRRSGVTLAMHHRQ